MKRWIVLCLLILFLPSSALPQIYVQDMINNLAARMQDPDKRSTTTATYLDALNLAQESLVGAIPPQALVDMITAEVVLKFPNVSGETFYGGVYKRWNLRGESGSDTTRGTWSDYAGNAVRNVTREIVHLISVKRDGYFCRLIKSVQPGDWDDKILNNATSESPVAIEMGWGILVRPECTTGTDTLTVYYVQKPRKMQYPLTIDTLTTTTAHQCTVKAFNEGFTSRLGGYAREMTLHNYTRNHDFNIINHFDRGIGGMILVVNNKNLAFSWGLAENDVCAIESELPARYHPLIIDWAEAILWSTVGKNPSAASGKMEEINFRLKLINAQYLGVSPDAIETQ